MQTPNHAIRGSPAQISEGGVYGGGKRECPWLQTPKRASREHFPKKWRPLGPKLASSTSNTGKDRRIHGKPLLGLATKLHNVGKASEESEEDSSRQAAFSGSSVWWGRNTRERDSAVPKAPVVRRSKDSLTFKSPWFLAERRIPTAGPSFIGPSHK